MVRVNEDRFYSATIRRHPCVAAEVQRASVSCVGNEASPSLHGGVGAPVEPSSTQPPAQAPSTSCPPPAAEKATGVAESHGIILKTVWSPQSSQSRSQQAPKWTLLSTRPSLCSSQRDIGSEHGTRKRGQDVDQPPGHGYELLEPMQRPLDARAYCTTTGGGGGGAIVGPQPLWPSTQNSCAQVAES